MRNSVLKQIKNYIKKARLYIPPKSISQLKIILFMERLKFISDLIKTTGYNELP